MSNRTWTLLIGAGIVAGLADWGTWALLSEQVRALDLTAFVRSNAASPVVVLAVKAGLVAAVALVGLIFRRLHEPIIEAAVALGSLGVALIWTYGAYTNIAFGWSR
jgi:hypothetical protein